LKSIQEAPPFDANSTRLSGNAGKARIDLAKVGQAKKELRNRIKNLGNPGLFQFSKKRLKGQMTKTLNELNKLKKFVSKQSKMNPKKFRNENLSTPLDRVSKNADVKKGRELGRGGLGVVYAGTAGGRRVVVKEALPDQFGRSESAQSALRDEANAGQALREAGKRKVKFLADVQGIGVAVIPQMRGKQLIQERVKGVDGRKAIGGESPAFKNGFVDKPQSAVERVAGLVLGLHGMHKAGQIHHDLKAQNIMVETQGTPKAPQFGLRIIDLGAAATVGKYADIRSVNAPPEFLAIDRKLRGISQELQAYRCECARRGVAADPQVEAWFKARLEAVIAEQAATTAPAYDMYTLGTMLPQLFFGECPVQGYGGQSVSLTCEFDRECWSLPDASGITRPSAFVNNFQATLDQCRERVTPEEIRQDPEIQRLNGELNQKLIELHNLESSDGSNEEKRQSLNQEINALKAQIGKVSSEVKERIAYPKAHDEMRDYILTRFRQMNRAMAQATGKFYPREVVRRLASMTADCLAMDPKRRPSAEQVLLALQNLALGDWVGEDGKAPTYGFMAPPETEDEKRIQGQFSWINPQPPPAPGASAV
jgi:serine/threonine protein kinase